MRLKIVRCFDYFDGWFDVTGPVKPAKAVHKWFRLTKGGTQNTGFTTGGTYFAIFPANTRMVYDALRLDQ